MKELIIVPIVGLMFIGFAVQLESIAQDSSEKALVYADDMNNAMDCAMHGIPIRECSPDLMNTTFHKEINQTEHVLSEYAVSLKEFYENLSENYTITKVESEDNGTIIIYVIT